jgi:hypothetical protein
MGYGPDNNSELRFPWAIIVEVPHGKEVHMEFSFNAYWENAVCVYELPALTKVAERGNYGRSSQRWTTPKNTQASFAKYLVTGWHKNSPPDGGQPWHQSPGRVQVEQSTLRVIGFEDSSDGDYNDAVVIASPA